MSRFFASIVGLVVAILIPAVAGAQQASTVQWQDDWRQVSTLQHLASGITGATALTFQFVGEKQDPWWTDEILVDLPIRTWVGANSPRGENVASSVSDYTLFASVASPWLLSVGAAQVGHHQTHVAGQLALITTQSLATTLGVTNAMKLLIGRERPRLSACFAEQLSDSDGECDPRPRVSFPSGHTSVAFTGAALTCAFGNALPLYGTGFSNQIPCIAAMTTASATAILRIVANAHHLSDVLFGVAIGLGSGFLIPNLLHFRPRRAEVETETQADALRIRPVPVSFGARF